MVDIPGGEWVVRFALHLRKIRGKVSNRGFMQMAWEIQRQHGDRSPESVAKEVAPRWTTTASTVETEID